MCAEVAQETIAEVERLAGERTVEVLHQDRDAAERTVGRGVGLGVGAVVAPMDHRVELRVHRVDARERGVDQLARRGRAVADQRGLGGGVEHGEIVGHAQDGNAMGQVSRTTSAAGLSSRSPR